MNCVRLTLVKYFKTIKNPENKYDASIELNNEDSGTVIVRDIPRELFCQQAYDLGLYLVAIAKVSAESVNYVLKEEDEAEDLRVRWTGVMQIFGEKE